MWRWVSGVSSWLWARPGGRAIIALVSVLSLTFVLLLYRYNAAPTTVYAADLHEAAARVAAHAPAHSGRVARADGPDLRPLYVHYVRFRPDDGNLTFRFLDYLSVMSAVQRLQPDGIFVHGDFEPIGMYWDMLTKKGHIQHRPRSAPTAAGQRMGKPKELGWKEHAADMVKLDVLLEYGGVAVDFDVFFVRGGRIRDILRRWRAITCYGDEDGYNIGFIAGWPDAALLYAWRRSYQDIYVKDWNFNQAFVSKYLSVLYREETYVANHVCNNPHPYNLAVYFHQHQKINWTNSLAIHSYERHGGVPVHSPDDLYTPGQRLTTHKELLLYIHENRTLPPYWEAFNDEMDPLTDKLKPRNRR
ncbi:uncharacterized protein LOC129598327 [Paramacrobiotus metropolitanus]|uniref:uncharacterized protein LOC129598327 n=1 Tax=Paramacrobiotus metropolitanus TaxID=2943436 RepID=UPI002445941B|nr:uncharacterized protein LOC129598327 [Paramacrobiotus metropolitanus]